MNINIRLAENKDKEAILTLLNAGFSKIQKASIQRGEEYWNWKFTNNPFGKSIVTIAEIDSRVIAVNNLWPWEFNIRGSVLRSLQPCDSVVHSDYQGKGLFKRMRLHSINIARDQNFSFIFNFPNQNSLPAYLLLGWHFQGNIPWMVKILKPLDVVRDMFSDHKTESVTIDDIYHLDINLINEVAQKDDSLDQYLKINRVAGFHEWRYLNHPYRSYGMIICEKGYKRSIAIFSINKKGDSNEMVVVDIVGSTENIIPLMGQVIEAGKKMKVSFIAIMNNPRYNTNCLWKIGFFKRKYKNMVVLPLDLGLENIVKGYSNWSLVAGLHDSI